MISNKEQLIEYCLERFASLEDDLAEAVTNKRTVNIHSIMGQMMELEHLYRHVTKTKDLNDRMLEIFKQVPT